MFLKNVIFMGTPLFGVPTLELLSKTKFKPVLCITQPDKPKGRNQKLTPPEIKVKALELNIPVIQPEDINLPEIVKKLEEIEPDIVVTAAYGGYFKKNIRLLPRFGCINLHPSLLPKYRGPAPINYALFNGDKVTGNTIFKIVAKMDAGPILYQSITKIEKKDNYTDLYKKLSLQGAEDVLKVLEKIESDNIEKIKQDETKVTFTSKILKEDMVIRWNDPAEKIKNQIRGLAEKPGAVAGFRGNRIKIIEVEVLDQKSHLIPGVIKEIIKNSGIIIATADYDLLLKKLQPAGKKIMGVYAFSLGARIKPGEIFTNGF
jgi:methionyl-tRNA formyltransferase